MSRNGADRAAAAGPAPGVRERLPRGERRLIWAIALIGALRVLFFSTVFPLFNNVDEFDHFDAVYKYSRGELPHPDRLRHGARPSSLIIWFASPEYVFRAPKPPATGYPPPLWSSPPEDARARAKEGVRRLIGVKNHELTQPPVYYAVAGAWYRLGEELGLACGDLLYSIRWLNALFMAGLVWTSHRLACAMGRGDPLTRIGVPLLIAVFPQDAFYSISNDALCPLLTALALLAILRMRAEPPRVSTALAAGLLAALAVLTKYTDCVVLIPAVVLPALHWFKRQARRRGRLPFSILFWIAALVPVAAWGARNAALFGDPTARRPFFQMLGWQTKPLDALFDHPLFSVPGLLHFLDGLCRDFWRGRFMWNGEFMAHGWADAVYVATSAVFLAAATLIIAKGLLHWLREGRGELSDESSVQTAAWLMVAGGVALLAFFSIWILTGERSVPPRSDPFFTMGRLIAGCTAPFVLLYVYGLGSATMWIPGPARAAVRVVLLGLVVTTVLVSEAWLSKPAASSEYGWLRVPRVEFGPCAASPSRRTGAAQEAGDHGGSRRLESESDDPD